MTVLQSGLPGRNQKATLLAHVMASRGINRARPNRGQMPRDSALTPATCEVADFLRQHWSRDVLSSQGVAAQVSGPTA